MGLLLLALVVVVAVVIGGAVALAARSRRKYQAANELIPGRASAAPAEWAGAHTPEARLHRRLVDVVDALRAHPLLEEGTGRLEARVELEEQAAAIDERLIAAAALPERVRDEPLARVEQEVAAVEQAAADLVTGTGPAALERPADEAPRALTEPPPAPAEPVVGAAAAGSTTIEVGDEFAGHRILEVIGSGGFATVYVGEDLRPAMRRKVAIKVLRSELSADPAIRDRFQRESLLAVQLDHHPSIVPVYDAGEADGHLYIAMRYIEGTDLKELLKAGPLDTDGAVSVITQIASALDLAHGAGLVHRDVKPANVLVPGGDTDHVYLADFGLTKETATEQSLTQIGQFLGTLYYAAPEQIQGKELDGRSDQYALGCLLYECLTGEPPFTGDVQAIIGAHLTREAPKATDKVPTLPAAIDAIIATAMAKEPADRYESCGELATRARAALSEPAPDGTDTPEVAPALSGLPTAPPPVDPAATVIGAAATDPGTSAAAPPTSTPPTSTPPTPPSPPVDPTATIIGAPTPAAAPTPTPADPAATIMGAAATEPATPPAAPSPDAEG